MTPPNNAPTVTGDDFDQFIQAEVEKAVAARLKAEGTPLPEAAPAAPPITLNLNGQNLQFKSADELSAALTNYTSQMQAKVAELEGKAAPPSPAPAITGDEKPTFDLKTFVDRLEKDPADAINLAVKQRVGMSLDEMKLALDEFKTLKEQSEQQRLIMTAAQFKDAHPEFPQDPRAGQVLEQVRNAYKLPFTTEGLEASYALAAQRGLLQSFQQQGAPPPPPQHESIYPPAMPNFGGRPPVAPPRAGRGSFDSAPPSYWDQAEDLSAEQIGNILNNYKG